MTMEQLKAKSLPPVPQSAVVSQRAEKSKIRVAKNDKTLSNSSSGLVAFSLTSTAVDLHVTAEHAYVSDLEMLYNHVDQNAFVTIETNMGKLNCELFCKQRPRTCHNFIGLSLKGHYDRSLFFKLEKDFLIQGGDPSGTGRFNDSLWGEKFKDEFRPFISFNSTGCLGMANYGEKHTNGSQFFITMQALPQLDNKYTIFGRVVGGLDVLKQMNHVDVDPSMRPIKEIIISRVLCINDPFRVAQELIDSSTSKPDDAVERCADLPQKDLKDEKQLQTTTYNASKRIGKYLKNNTNSGQQDANQVDEKNQSNAGSSKPNVSSFDDW
ncbi:MAG: RING-type E3 ubiquitin-protein ligase ppil2 [Marteilia pararefringens]